MLLLFGLLLTCFGTYGQLTLQQTLPGAPPGNYYFPGQFIAYQLALVNTSAGTINNIVLQSNFSAQFIGSSITFSIINNNTATYTVVGNVLTINIASMPYQGNAFIGIGVQLANPSPCGTFSQTVSTLTNSTSVISSSLGMGGPTASASASLGPPTTTYTIPNSASSTNYGSGFQNAYITVNGDFNIVDLFNISNCVLNMAPNSEIRIVKIGNLTMQNNYLFSCGALWKGVHAIEGPLQLFRSNRIEDAENAVYLENNPSVLNNTVCWVAYNHFINNYIGVYVAPSAFNSINLPSNMHIRDNTFEGGSLQAVNQVPHLGWAYAGVVMNNLSFISANPPFGFTKNRFTNLCNGILATRCDWLCYKNTFDNIQPFAAYNVPNYSGANINGVGLYARQLGKLQVLGFGGIPNVSQISFDNCKYGIITERVNTYIETTRMENMYDGIYCGSSMGGQTILVNSNSISSWHKGVELQHTDAATVNVTNNVIKTGYLSGAVGLGCISANNFNNNASNTTIFNNILTVNRALYGIYATQVGGIIMNNNTVTLNSPLNRMGIGISNCNNAFITCNNVLGLSAVGNATYTNVTTQTAIAVENSTNWNISLNDINQTIIGFRFKGICNSADKFTLNNLFNHYVGLYVPASGNSQMGIQTHRGNKWLGTYGLNPANANGANWALSRFYVNNPSGTQFFPNNTVPGGWFWPLPGTPFSAQTCGIAPIVADSANLDAFDYTIAMDSVNDPEYPAETQYSADRYLLEKLKKNSQLIAASGIIHDFYAEQAGQSLDILSGVSLSTYMLAVSAWRTNLDSLRNQSALLQIQTRSTDSLIEVTTDSLDLQNLQSEMATLLAEMGSLSHTMAATEDNIAAEQAYEAAYLAAQNATVEDSRLIVTNEQVINDIYYTTLGSGVYEFSPQQLADIDSIAFQCLPLGGVGVYKARGIRAWLYGESDYDDTETCAQQGISWRKPDTNAQAQKVSLSPNPASTTIELRFAQPIAANTSLTIYNSVGQEIEAKILPEYARFYPYTVSALTSGVYFYTLNAGNQVLTGKFIKQ